MEHLAEERSDIRAPPSFLRLPEKAIVRAALLAHRLLIERTAARLNEEARDLEEPNDDENDRAHAKRQPREEGFRMAHDLIEIALEQLESSVGVRRREDAHGAAGS